MEKIKLNAHGNNIVLPKTEVKWLLKNISIFNSKYDWFHKKLRLHTVRERTQKWAVKRDIWEIMTITLPKVQIISFMKAEEFQTRVSTGRLNSHIFCLETTTTTTTLLTLKLEKI